MKHDIKKFEAWRAGCCRPGCVTSIESIDVEKMSQQEIESILASDCPRVPTAGNENELPEKQRILYLIRRAKKELETYQHMISYWEKKL